MAQLYDDLLTGEVVDENGIPVNQEALETGPWESALIGAGKTIQNMGEGIGVLDPLPGDDYMGDLRKVNPLSTMAGEAAPTMVGPLGVGRLGQLGYGAGMGYMASEEGNREGGAALGAAGAGVGDMVGRVLGRAWNMIRGNDEATEAAKRLMDSGYQLTPAQKTGSQAAMKVERSFEKNPYLQDIPGEIADHNESLLLSRANEAVGLPAEPLPLDRAARQVAADQVGANMEAAAQGVSIEVPESLANRVSRIIKNDDMLEIPELPAGGTVSGTDYMRIRSDLSRAHRSAQGSTQDYIGKTIDQLDDEFIKNAGPDQAQAYRVAREQYKNLIQLEKGKALTPDGMVNYKTAGNAFRSKTGYGSRSVENTLPETQQLIGDLDALSGKAVNPYIGNSGTPEGLGSYLNPFTMGGGLLGKMYYGAPAGALTPSAAMGPALGANIGRAGLLSSQ